MRRILRRRVVVGLVGIGLVAGAVVVPGGAPVSATGSHVAAAAPGAQSVAESGATYVFHVGVTPAPETGPTTAHEIAVDFSIGSASTATCGTDYSVTAISSAGPTSSLVPSCGPPPPHGTLVFPAGDSDETITFTITNDASNEGNETVVVNLFNARCINGPTGGCPADVHPSGADAPAVGTLTITDDDAATFTIADASANEGDPLVFNVSVSPSPALGQTATVKCTHDTSFTGTATPTTDFDATERTLTFQPGDTTLPCSFPTVEDTTDEANETLRIKLTSAAGTGGYPTNPTATDTGIGTITNDDGPNGARSAGVNDVSANEGDALQFTVTLNDACPASTTATIPFDTRHFGTAQPSGTAQETTDYPRTQGTLTFTGTEKTKTVSITSVEDTTNEPDETFSLFLGPPTGTCGVAITDGEGVGTIKNDDTVAPTPSGITIAAGVKQVREGDSLTRPCFVPVTLNTASTAAVTVKYATADGTATEDEDYAKNSGTLTFAPGVTTQRVEITVFGDTVNDKGRRESVLVNLTSPTGATIADAQGKCKIYEGRKP